MVDPNALLKMTILKREKGRNQMPVSTLDEIEKNRMCFFRHEFPPFSNNSFASLTLVARYGLPPRSGWLSNISFLWFFLILSLATCGFPSVLSLSSRINAASFLVIFGSNPPL